MNTYHCTYKSGARRTVKARDWHEAMQRATLASGTKPDSCVLHEDREAQLASIERAAAAFRARHA